MVILAIRHIYLHFIMTYTYIISIEFSHMMNDYMVHMVHRITTSRTDTAPARLTSSSSARRPASRRRHQHTGHRPRSPMRFYVYGEAPPPSFTHVWRIASVTEGQDLIMHIVHRFYACKQTFDVLYIGFVF